MNASSAGPDGTSGGALATEVSLVALGAVFLRHARILVTLPLLLAALALGSSLLRQPEWVARSRLMPEALPRDLGQFTGLASQLGLAIGGGRETESIDFYAELITSANLLRDLALSEFDVVSLPDSVNLMRGNLLEIYRIEGATELRRIHRVQTRLRTDIKTQAMRRSGMLEIVTHAPWPALAEALNRRILQLVTRFNQDRRQSKAAAERQFIEGRLAVVRDSLAAAQQALTLFNLRNRQLTNATPALVVEQSALERNVQVLQAVYTTLAESYERARIDEVRNTPVVTIVDPPEATAKREGGRLRLILLAMVLGGTIAVVWAFLHEHVNRRRTVAPDEYEQFVNARRQLLRGPSRVTHDVESR